MKATEHAELSMDAELTSVATQISFYNIIWKDVGGLGLNAVFDLLWQIVWLNLFHYIQVNDETWDITETLISVVLISGFNFIIITTPTYPDSW